MADDGAESDGPESDSAESGGLVPIADAVAQLGMSRRELLQRLRLHEVGDLRYDPAHGGWFIPRSVVEKIARER